MMDAAPINQVALAARREARQGARVFVRVPLAKRFAFRRGLWRSLEFWRKGLAGKTPRSATEFRFAVEPAAAMRYDFRNGDDLRVKRLLSGPFARSPFALRPHVDNANQLLLGVDRELLVDMLDVRSRRGPRDAQFRRYGIGMIAFGEQHKDFGFTWGQAVRLGDRIASIAKAPAWDFAPFSGFARNRMLIVGVVVGA